MRNIKKTTLSFLAVILLSFVSTHLQAQAKIAIYGTVGGEKPGIINGNSWGIAGTVGLYLGVVNPGPLALSVDARADLASNIKSGFAGPRLALRLPALPLKPYVEALVGWSGYPSLPDGLPVATKFTSRAVAGLDTTILPHIDWRVIDFTYGITAATPHASSITSGLVVRF
jgi:hypothetical protein